VKTQTSLATGVSTGGREVTSHLVTSSYAQCARLASATAIRHDWARACELTDEPYGPTCSTRSPSSGEATLRQVLSRPQHDGGSSGAGLLLRRVHEVGLPRQECSRAASARFDRTTWP
jgi:hypothetical protein